MTALFTACSNEDDPVNQQATPVSFTVNKEVTTRSVTSAENDGTYKTKFTVDESIGVYGAEKQNVKYTFKTATTVGSDSPIDIYDSQAYTFNVYSPYSVDNSASVSFSVKENQTSETDFNASNFLTGTGTHAAGSGNSVALTFAPKLALVYIKVTGPVGGGTKAVIINNVHKSITWTPGSEPTTVTSDGVASVQMHRPDPSEQVYLAFVPAQAITQGTTFLTFAVGVKQYVYKPSTNVNLAAGSRNIFNVTIGENTINLVATVSEATWSDTSDNTVGWENVEEYNYITMPATTEEIKSTTNVFSTESKWFCNGPTINSISDGVLNISGISNSSWYQATLFYYSSEVLEVGKYTLTIKAKTSTAAKYIKVALYGAQKVDSNTRYYSVDDADNKAFISNTIRQTENTYTWTINLRRCVDATTVADATVTSETDNNSENLQGFRIAFWMQNDTYEISDIKLVRTE